MNTQNAWYIDCHDYSSNYVNLPEHNNMAFCITTYFYTVQT